MPADLPTDEAAAEYAQQLSAEFGPDYAAVIVTAASIRQTLTGTTADHDPLNTNAVAMRLAHLYQLEGVLIAARQILRVRNPPFLDPTLVAALPERHMRTMQRRAQTRPDTPIQQP